MNINEKLFRIQQAAKATKSQYNSFGKYSYRSAEGIIEDIKPVLSENNTIIVLSDKMEEVGGRVYVCAMASLVDIETGERVSTTAYAREAETKKGMDESQITGAASSYARKYALSGLLLLDDNKDADTEEYQNKVNSEANNTASEAPKVQEEQPTVIKTFKCTDCKKQIKEHQGATAEQIANATKNKYGVMLCVSCAGARKAKAEAEAQAQGQGNLPFPL